MNVIFISPHFPDYFYNFCDRLKVRGVRVLGIGDANYENLPYHTKLALTEYYRVDDLEDYRMFLMSGYTAVLCGSAVKD